MINGLSNCLYHFKSRLVGILQRELSLRSTNLHLWSSKLLRPLLLKKADGSFVPRPLAVKLDIAECLGYVGEQVPVIIKIKNDDDRKVYLRLSVFLPPNEDEHGMFPSLSTISKLMDRSHCKTRRPRIDIAFTRHHPRPTRAFFK